MIGADEADHASALGRDELRAPVPADVVEGPHLPVIAAHEDHRLRPDVDPAIIPSGGHLGLEPGEDPVAPEDGVEVEVEHLPRGVEWRLERMARPARFEEASDIERGSMSMGAGSGDFCRL